MPLTIADLCSHLNTQADFVSPPAGQNMPIRADPFLNLAIGTRKLILIADTFHDFKHVSKLEGMPGKPKPGSELLKTWARSILSTLGLLNLTTAAGKNITLIEFVNLIYTHPEEFVFNYLYHKDIINVISSDDMYEEEESMEVEGGGGRGNGKGKRRWRGAAGPGEEDEEGAAAGVAGEEEDPPVGTNTNFIIFPFPELAPGCPDDLDDLSVILPDVGSNESSEISKTSAKKLYNFFKPLQTSAATWATNDTLEGYNAKIDTLDTLWWSWDQGSTSKIFQDYDIAPDGNAGDANVVTNWWQWFGYAAQYDRVEMTDPKVNKLYINKLYPDTAVYDLKITLPTDDGILGVNSLELNADSFTWTEIKAGVPVNTTVNYDLEQRTNLKNLLANAIGYLSARHTLNIGKLFIDIFEILSNVATMINQLIPDVVKYNASQNPIGIDPDGRNWVDIISILTDFKRIGDYMQAKELYAIQPLKEMNIPLQTHDSILAAISNKIFNNYTVWVKGATGKRCGAYVLMLPFDNADGVSIPLDSSVPSEPLNGKEMTGHISVILELLSEGEYNDSRPGFWGGKKKRERKKKGRGKGGALELPPPPSLPLSHSHAPLPPSRKRKPELETQVAGIADHAGYNNFKKYINDIFNINNSEPTVLAQELNKYYTELESIVLHHPHTIKYANKRKAWIKKLLSDKELLNFVISYTHSISDENPNPLFNMITDFYINNYIIPVNNDSRKHDIDKLLSGNRDVNGYILNIKRGGNIKSEILGKIVKYIEQIKIIKENIKKLNKNKNKNKDIITIKKKLIEKILIKIKKEKEKEKQKIKKEREKEKQKIKKEREKEKQKIKKEREKEKIKKEKEIKKKDKLKKNKNKGENKKK